MKLSELIKEAQESLKEFGDIDVVTFDIDMEKPEEIVKPASIMIGKHGTDTEWRFFVAAEELVDGVDDAGEV